MKVETFELKQQAEQARTLYRIGKLSRNEAKEQIEPYVTAVNKKSVEIAKKYNQKPRLVSVIGFMR
ncbi:MAG: hypothetical protein LBV67_09005 [Streptococcaceae bacterium]|jgi:hypothetical protein|nr:hypothetical protein [Streptococcaceae bacterium]